MIKLKTIGASFLLGVISTFSLIALYREVDHTSISTYITLFILLTGFAYLFVQPLGADKRNFIHFMKRRWVIVFLVLFSIVMIFSLRDPEGSFHWYSIGVYLLSYVVIFTLTAGVLYFFTKVSVPLEWKKVSKWWIVAYAVLPILIWSFFLVGFFPATMTPDSLSHWRQIHTFEFDNWHPVVYTWFILGLSLIWESPAIVALSQIVILSLIGGYAAYELDKRGLSRWYIWVGIVLFAFFPLNGAYSIVIWKDIFFSGFLLFFTILIYNIVSTKGQWLTTKSHLFMLGIAALSISLMRSNGLPIFIVMSLLLLWAFPKYIKRLLLTLVLVGGINFLITGPLFSYFDVKSTSANEALSIPTQQIGRIIVEDGQMTEEQEEYLYQILPEDKWEALYFPYVTDGIKFSEHYNSSVIFEDFGYFMSTWASLVSNNFGLAVEAYFDQTSLLWQINLPDNGYVSTIPRTVYQPNQWDMVTDPLSEPVHTFLIDTLDFLEKHLMEIIFRPAIYTSILLITGTALALKNGVRSLLVILPVLLNTGTLLLAIPAQDFRYQFPNVLITFLMMGVVFIKHDSSKKELKS